MVWLEEISFSSKHMIFENNQWVKVDSNNVDENNNLIHIGPVTDLGIMSLFVESVRKNPFSNLIKLKKLFINGTQSLKQEFRSLEPLRVLLNIKILDISHTKIVDLEPLSNLSTLQQINLSNTLVVDLSPFSLLVNLQQLNLSNTRITDLSPISGLTNLDCLDISNTRITDLKPLLELIKKGYEVKWSSNFWEGNGIYVENCPLTNPGLEIIKQGNEAILNFFQEQISHGTDRLYEAKLVIIGQGRTGKTRGCSQLL